MQLLSLTLDGFKSFAQKTTIKFEPGMTGIVGPNGSGKSNIIEAIRWVMGEQSAKHLRGDKMADVIFNGSTDRKPLNRAVVSITFDNSDHYLASDYTELTITRKLYRNGDSEYLINGHNVRLKDITDLFIDSGLGRESFSIISQGRVAAVFNGKPVDRRGIIETVAGVAKYKKNKDTAEKRLATTMDNLNRVNDIISELSKQLDPLENESALAQDYLEQKKRFDLLDRTQTVRLYDQQHDHFDQIDHKYQQINQLINRYRHQAKEVLDRLTEQKHQRSQLLQQKDTLQQQILQHTEMIAELNNQQSVSSVRKKQQEAEQQRLGQQEVELKKTATELKGQLTQVDQTIADHQKEISRHQAELKVAQQMSSKERLTLLNQQLDQLRDQQIELMQKITTIHNQQAFLNRSHEQNVSQQTQNTTDLEQKLRQRQELLTKLEKFKQQVQKLTVLLQGQQASQERVSQQLRQVTTDYQHGQRKWYELLGDAHSTRERIKSYQAMSSEYAGYYQGVKTVLQNRQQFSGLAGAVSELFDVPNNLTIAIETVLGSQLQQLVVDSQATGKAIISYLTRKRGGRVTILPLDTLSRRRPVTTLNQVINLPGFIGHASELVNFAPQYQLIADYLLGNTVVVDNLDHATTIARAGRHQLRVVTLDGQLINASGAMTGGANRQQRHGLLSQKQVGKQLQALLNKQESQAKQLESQVAGFKRQQETLQQEATTIQGKLQAYQEELHGVQTDQQLLTSQINTLDSQITILKNQTAQQTDQDQDYKQRQAEFTKQEEATNEKLVTVKNQVERITDQAQKLANDESAQTEQLHQMEQWLAVATERLHQYQQQRQTLASQLADAHAKQQKIKDQLENLGERLANHSSSVESTGEALAKTQTALKIAKQTQQNCNKKLSSLEAKLAEHEARHNRLQELQQAASDDANRLNEQRVSCEAQIDHYLNHLTDQYQMTISEARQNTSDLDDQQLAIQLKLLKRGLADLGDVNVGAIDEYQRVKEHYDFLKGQQDDLLAARQQLNQTMTEMDNQVKGRFATTFKNVSAAFDETFQQIFGGGHAKLVLTDPHDLLTTGVDIMAQPPGKKNQRLSLLSGGERALTAITLLFAILKVRPVPFAILDEPEAALDEVNVQRFANYLSRFGTQGPQFIVITHRKGTMMGADVLYGVTMQESGVSKMVSVDVTETLDNNGD